MFKLLNSLGQQNKSKYRFVFIVAYGRSGSTILQKIIGSIDGYHITGENNGALAGLFASYESALRTKAEQGLRPRDTLGDPWYGAHLIDPERYIRKLASIFVEEILRPPRGTRVVGFKEIRYFDFMDTLEQHLDCMRAVFKPALLVFNKRNGADVAKSGWWRDCSPEEIMADVAIFDKKAEAYLSQYTAESIIVDYDAYRCNPNHLKILFDQLGEPFDHHKIEEIMKERLTH